MPYDNLDRDRPPEGWTAEMAMGLGLVLCVIVAIIVLGCLVFMFW